MKILLFTFWFLIIIFLIAISFYMVLNSISHWGWFLFIALLMLCGTKIRTNKNKKS